MWVIWFSWPFYQTRNLDFIALWRGIHDEICEKSFVFSSPNTNLLLWKNVDRLGVTKWIEIEKILNSWIHSRFAWVFSQSACQWKDHDQYLFSKISVALNLFPWSLNGVTRGNFGDKQFTLTTATVIRHFTAWHWIFLTTLN